MHFAKIISVSVMKIIGDELANRIKKQNKYSIIWSITLLCENKKNVY